VHGHLTFVPAPLPPDLPFDIGLVRLLSEADPALGELAGVGRLKEGDKIASLAKVPREENEDANREEVPPARNPRDLTGAATVMARPRAASGPTWRLGRG
jgi:hypothetical protein